MDSANTVWTGNLQRIIADGQPVRPRDQETLECLAYTSQVDMTMPIVSIRSRRLSYRFMAAQAHWILTGDNRIEPLARHAPSIRRFSDDGITFYGAYGPQLLPQMSYVVRTLLDDSYSRQAVATIWCPCPPKTKDVPCTVSVQWFIRDGALHCVDTMRSSDLWLGWPYDVFSFTMITAFLALCIRAMDSVFISAISRCRQAASIYTGVTSAAPARALQTQVRFLTGLLTFRLSSRQTI